MGRNREALLAMGDEQTLLYNRWVKNERKKVEELSGGKVGLRSCGRAMNDK
jgi:hypothetical protein